jgi:hypothetical protein
MMGGLRILVADCYENGPDVQGEAECTDWPLEKGQKRTSSEALLAFVQGSDFAKTETPATVTP